MIDTPKSFKTRPTSSMLRQALFNSLQAEIPDAQVLDLFAGSGALGFEAISRGAAQVISVENNRAALQALKKNIETLRLKDQVKVIELKVEDSLSQLLLQAPYDLVLADPPYSEGWEMWLLEKMPWEKLLKLGGRFSLEWGTVKSQVSVLPEKTEFLVKIREKIYGDSQLTTYERVEPTSAQEYESNLEGTKEE